MALKREHLEEVVASIGKNRTLQKQILEELPAEIDEEREIRTKAIIRVPEDAALVTPEGGLSETGRRVAETIVNPIARPVLVIQSNRVTETFLGPDSDVWRQRLRDARGVLDRVIPAVGRVEVDNHPNYTWVGTGWLIDPQVVVTNRHVAREFARRDGKRLAFRPGLGGRVMQCTIDFLEEYERASELDFKVESVLWIAPVRDPDVAFLKVRSQPGRDLPAPIGLAPDGDYDDRFVATIGYPARDSRIPDQDVVRRVFGDVYEKKRLAPGEVTELTVENLLHDCSTLGGNSGSPVIDLQTGEALGLHYSGLYRQANYAIPAGRVRALLTALQRHELVEPEDLPARPHAAPSPATIDGTGTTTHTSAMGVTHSVETDASGMTMKLRLPLEISVRLGLPASAGTVHPTSPVSFGSVPQARPAAPVSQETALQVAQTQLVGHPDVISVALGYRFRRGWISNERTITVTVKKKRTPEELRSLGQDPLPTEIGGMSVDVRTGALREQLAALGVSLESFGLALEGLEAPSAPGAYRPPTNVRLTRVRENMHAIFHVSPDAGFPTLREFLKRVDRDLTATMYEWDADHVSDAIVESMKNRADTLRLVTQKPGTQNAIEDLRTRFNGKLLHTWASVTGAGKLFPRAYHIKVASRDGEEFWLSSGNWKTSGQPKIDPAGDGTTTIAALRKYNREWHAVIRNPKLAMMFQQFIEWDFDEAQRVGSEEVPEPVLPDLFVPDLVFAPELERPEVRYHKPLIIDRELDVQPLLTPDWTADGERMFVWHATEMLREARDRIYLQNQSFNLLKEGDNIEEFERFMLLLADRQRDLDVRIIFRDPREFGAGGAENLQVLLERCKDIGLDTGRIKVQRACHTKGLIVDGEQVLLGSHNLTNMGALFNRDASLRVRDPEVAMYFERIFEYDWDVLAKQDADELVGGIRLAGTDEETPVGYRRINLHELIAEM
jgi:PLD-like domain/Trypsin-like peptidase domain